MSKVEVRTPSLGDFAAVDVIEIHVKPGDRISAEDPLVTLETDKATMDIPAPRAGTVVSVALQKGAKVSAGDLVLTLEAADGAAAETADKPADKPIAAAPVRAEASTPSRAATPRPPHQAAAAEPLAVATPPPGKRLAVIGAGPGGYTAAFRAADLGLEVTLVERWSTLGGVCLNVGCIPSKALLHAARVIEEAHEMGARGIAFGEPKLDTKKLVDWKTNVVRQLTNGLDTLAKQRKLRVVRGTAR
ncbi:MAG TPA: biotin/lipoyl-containing protein, partial [Gammaproteobacteria bacterium]|nr:biotin/lipoyl-containing protein [Gammaproteobacteria bacterium]